MNTEILSFFNAALYFTIYAAVFIFLIDAPLRGWRWSYRKNLLWSVASNKDRSEQTKRLEVIHTFAVLGLFMLCIVSIVLVTVGQGLLALPIDHFLAGSACVVVSLALFSSVGSSNLWRRRFEAWARWYYASKPHAVSGDSALEGEKEQAAWEMARAFVGYYVLHWFSRQEGKIYFRDDQPVLSCIGARHVDSEDVIERTRQILDSKGWTFYSFHAMPYSQTMCFGLQPTRKRIPCPC